MTRARAGRLLALAGLGVTLGLLWWPPVSAFALAAGVPVAAVIAAGLRPGRRWGGWVAVIAIPYMAGGVMNLLAGPAPPAAGLAMAASTVVAFFAGLDWNRQTGGSLR